METTVLLKGLIISPFDNCRSLSCGDTKPENCPAHVRHTDVRNTDPLPFPANKAINRFINIAISIPIRMIASRENVRNTSGTRTSGTRTLFLLISRLSSWPSPWKHCLDQMSCSLNSLNGVI